VWPDQPYAEDRGSFRRPVPVVPFDPDSTPTKTVVVNCQWLPYIRGALQQLLLQATWATDDPAILQRTQDRVFNLIDLFSECDASDLPFACPYDFSTSDGGWVVETNWVGSTPVFFGQYSAGIGWVETDQIRPGGAHYFGCDIHKPNVSGEMLTDYTLDVDFSPGDGVTGTFPALRVFWFLMGVLQRTDTYQASSLSTGHNHIVHSGSVSFDDVEINVITGAGWTVSPGAATITGFEVFGTGVADC